MSGGVVYIKQCDPPVMAEPIKMKVSVLVYVCSFVCVQIGDVLELHHVHDAGARVELELCFMRMCVCVCACVERERVCVCV